MEIIEAMKVMEVVEEQEVLQVEQLLLTELGSWFTSYVLWWFDCKGRA